MVFGALQMVGGAKLTVAGVVTVNPLAAGGGLALAVNGADDFWAGAFGIWTGGGYQDTFELRLRPLGRHEPGCLGGNRSVHRDWDRDRHWGVDRHCSREGAASLEKASARMLEKAKAAEGMGEAHNAALFERYKAELRALEAQGGGHPRRLAASGGLTETEIAERFRTLENFRKGHPSLPDVVTGSRKADGVAAMIETDAGATFGASGWIGRSDKSYTDVLRRMKERGMKPNAQSPTHAEGEAAFHLMENNMTPGGMARVFVDAPFCTTCGQSRGVENMLRGLGFDSAEAYIRLGNGHIVHGTIF